jgi:hypothetical protein
VVFAPTAKDPMTLRRSLSANIGRAARSPNHESFDFAKPRVTLIKAEASL